MNKTHRLANGNNSKKKKVTSAKLPEPNKYALINLCLALILGTVLCIALYTPFTYSTLANNRIVKELTKEITETYGGIVASNEPVEVEGYDYMVKSSQDFIMNNGDMQLDYLRRFEELGILKSNVNIDDLWAIYYTYFSSDYNENIELYKQLVAWYSDLDKEDNSNYENTCTDERCLFVTEMTNILSINSTEIINSNAHSTYHAQLTESVSALELSEADLQRAYEAHILSNANYLASLSIDFTLLNQTLLTKNTSLANWALNTDNGVVTWVLGNIKYSEDFNSDEIKEVLRYIDITLDDEIVTDEIIAYVPNALLAYGVDSDGLVTDNTTIVNVTDIENLEEWLSENNNKKSYKDVTTDTQFIDLGYAKLHWDIKSIDYTENIPTFEECINDTTWLNTIRTQLVEQAIWQKFYTGE